MKWFCAWNFVAGVRQLNINHFTCNTGIWSIVGIISRGVGVGDRNASRNSGITVNFSGGKKCIAWMVFEMVLCVEFRRGSPAAKY